MFEVFGVRKAYTTEDSNICFGVRKPYTTEDANICSTCYRGLNTWNNGFCKSHSLYLICMITRMTVETPLLSIYGTLNPKP